MPATGGCICGSVSAAGTSAAATARRTATRRPMPPRAGHALIRSIQPGEDWSWCFVDEIAMEIPEVTGEPPDPALAAGWLKRLRPPCRRDPARRAASTPACPRASPPRSGALPVAGDRERSAVEAAVDDQVPAERATHRPRRGRSLVAARAGTGAPAPPRRAGRGRARRRRRGAPSAATRSPAVTQLLLLLGPVDGGDDPRPARRRRSASATRRSRAARRVADEQVPVGVGIGR